MPSRKEILAKGKSLRERCPRRSHGEFRPTRNRFDPLALLEASNKGRVPELIPIRWGRMLQSPFTFFRGAAAVMAADLAKTPSTGLHVQACGDCHLLNFGGFATPERRLAFDINDFDETLPAPWEWDLKRLAVSFVIAARNNDFSKGDARDAAQASVRSYRKRMIDFAGQRALDVWYARIDLDKIVDDFGDPETRRRLRKRIAKAAQRDVVEDDYPKMVAHNGGRPVIRDNPPLIYHWSHLPTSFGPALQKTVAAYRATLPEDRRVLLDRYRLVDLAAKVVGVGSVGTRCGVALFAAGDDDPLFLQVKEARRSVFEPYVGASPYANRGQRVVIGQRLMQAASDLFLGWAIGPQGTHFYVRQLRDMKLKPLTELFTPLTMREYAKTCGWALARAHARSGSPGMIAGYLGKSEAFDEALADFAVAYADQNERDWEALRKAVRDGRIKVQAEA
jgi:uncharacterized protein (DUF2252 family)